VHVLGDAAGRSDNLRDRRFDQLGVMHTRQRDEPHSIGMAIDELRRHLQSKPCLADSAWADERDEPMGFDELEELGQITVAPDQRRRLHREVRLMERFQTWEIAVTELPDPLWRRQILQPVVPQITQPVRRDQLTRRLRHQHLAAVASGRDARRAMDVDPHVTLVRQERLAGMHAHPHADRSLQLRLRLARCRQRIRRTRERDEERIPLSVHLDAAVTTEHATQHAAVVRQRIGIRIAEPVQQPRRALDIREEERDRSRRKRSHRSMMRRPASAVQALGREPLGGFVQCLKREVDRLLLTHAATAAPDIVERLGLDRIRHDPVETTLGRADLSSRFVEDLFSRSA
jgi:hypothetical protein